MYSRDARALGAGCADGARRQHASADVDVEVHLRVRRCDHRSGPQRSPARCPESVAPRCSAGPRSDVLLALHGSTGDGRGARAGRVSRALRAPTVRGVVGTTTFDLEVCSAVILDTRRLRRGGAPSSATLSAGATAVAAFVGFTAKAPKDDPSDPDGPSPGSSRTGPSSRSCTAASSRARCSRSRSTATSPTAARSPTSCASRTPSRPASRAPGAPVRGPRTRPRRRVHDRRARRRHHRHRDPRAGAEATTTTHRRRSRSRSSRDDEPEEFSGLTLGGIDAAVNGTSTKVKVETKIDVDQLAADLQTIPTGSFAIEPAAPTPVAVPAARSPAPSRPARASTASPIAEDVTMVIVPDLVTAATREDGTVDLNLWKAVQTALITHCEQNRQPDGRPRRTSRHVAAADQGVAQRHRDVRLGVRRAVLPVDRRSTTRPASTATARS